MIEKYSIINRKIKATQLLNDSESMEDVKELLGDNFIGFETDSKNRLHVYYKIGKYGAHAYASQNDFILRREDDELVSIDAEKFKNNYKKVWD